MTDLTQNSVVPTIAHNVAELAPSKLEALGLTLADQPDIERLAAGLSLARRDELSRFGHEAAEQSSRYADKVLDQVRSGDLEGMGGKLSEVVSSAQSLNLHALGDKRSRIPVVGPLLDKLRQSKDDLVNQFSTVKSKIERLMDEVTTMQRGLASRITLLDEGFTAIKGEYRQLGLHIAAGSIGLQRMGEEITQGQALVAAGQLSPLQLQEVQDRIAAVEILRKRVDDMRVLQHSALQTLPMIRLVQTNNAMLVEKFHTIKELTLPAWKRQFMMALSLSEQRSAVELAGNIDEATNDFLKENARLLKQNTIATAKSNQRLMIDVATLQEVQATLLSTVQEVIKINQEGLRQRAGVADQLSQMREQLREQLTKNA
jgi:uncharacterized protein YaaN involved in tellurite resistance